MRVNLDTNVLVSAVTTRGLCADLFQVVVADHDLIVGDTALAELRSVLERKLRLNASTITELIAFLRRHGEMSGAGAPLPIAVRDPKDQDILAEAVTGRADVLVTGDEDLLTLAARAPVPIRSPREFWEMLRTR